jgi:HEAT repeat protein
MAREPLQGLAADVNRLLAGGAADLPRHERALRRMARQVPALAGVAEAVRQAGAGGLGRGLLGLLVAVRAVCAALARAGVGVEGGTLEAVEPAGPWATGLPERRLAAVLKTLSDSGRHAHWVEFRAAFEAGILGDLRLVGPFFAAVPASAFRVLITEEVLPEFGPALVPDLCRRLDDGGDTAHPALLVVLCRVDEAAGAERCLAILRQGGGGLRATALMHLPASVPTEVVDRVLRPFLTGERDSFSSQALWAWAKRGRPAAADVPFLLALLDDKNDGARAGAAVALGAVGPEAACAVPAVRKVLGSLKLPPFGGLAVPVLEALGAIGPAARECVPDLLRFAKMRHEGHARAALQTLARIDGLGRVREFLQGPHPRRRAVAASALGGLGGLAGPAVPDLEAALGDAVIGVRFAAAAALVELGTVSDRVMAVLLEGLNGKGYLRRREALEVLSRLGPRAAAAAPALEKLAAGKDYFLREGSLAALRAIRGVP